MMPVKAWRTHPCDAGKDRNVLQFVEGDPADKRERPGKPLAKRLPGALSRTDAQRLAGEWTLSVVYSGERTTSDANSLHRTTSRRSCCLT